MGGSHILIVDKVNHTSIITDLESAGHTVYMVAKSEDAFKVVNQSLDLILVADYMINVEFEQLIRSARRFSHPALILIRSFSGVSIETIRLMVGATGVIDKPFGAARILELLDNQQPGVFKQMCHIPQKPHVFIVDDDELVLFAAHAILEDDYEVTSTSSPYNALLLLQQQPCEIFLTDLMMDELSGLDLIHAIKNNHPLIQVISMTGYANKEVAIAALKEGAYDFLEKPLTPEIVRYAVERAWISLRSEMEKNKLIADLQSNNILLKTLANKAEVASLAKSKFLSSMSHEIRTPLNAIIGFAQVMQFNAQVKSEPSLQEGLKQITSAGDHLLHLVNDILELAVIEQGGTVLSISHIVPIRSVRAALDSVKGLADSHEVNLDDQFSNESFPLIYADQTRLIQILINLLSNAIKYNVKQGQVIISGKMTSDQYLKISIEDTGCGIADDMKPYLFQSFNRLGMENGHIEGAGIGMIIVKQLVELMNGRFGFNSEESKGSLFWVEFPVFESNFSKVDVDTQRPVSSWALKD